MRSVQQVSCAVKDAFPSRRAALAVARHQTVHADRTGKRRPTLSVFKCGVCHAYHVGGVDTSRPRRSRLGEF